MPAKVKIFLQQWAISTLAVLVASQVVKGIQYETWPSLLAATLLLGLLNTFVRPLLTLLSLPLMIVTLGLFRVVINACLLLLVSKLVDGFHADGFSSAFWGALVISIVSFALNALTGTGEARFTVQRGKRPPPSKSDAGNGPGNGPVIDV